MDSRDILDAGTILDRKYRIDRIIGAGGFGVTYEALDLGLEIKVAIKEYYPAQFAFRDSTSSVRPRSAGDRPTFDRLRQSFLREARTLARFEHPAIVGVISVFEAHGTAYMVMRYESGKSLKAWLAYIDRLPTQAEMDRLVEPLLSALEVMHAADFMHRDIAPDNIIIRPDETPVLLDFGASRRVLRPLSASLTGVVKQGFSPQEQYASDGRGQGPWTDIYAFGATLYRAVTGATPLEATARMLDDGLVPAKVAGQGKFRPEFLAAIDHAMQLYPRDRPQSVATWRQELLPPPAQGRVPGRPIFDRPRTADAPRQRATLPSIERLQSKPSRPSLPALEAPESTKGSTAPSAARRPQWQRAAVVALVAGAGLYAGMSALGATFNWWPAAGPQQQAGNAPSSRAPTSIEQELRRLEEQRLKKLEETAEAARQKKVTEDRQRADAAAAAEVARQKKVAEERQRAEAAAAAEAARQRQIAEERQRADAAAAAEVARQKKVAEERQRAEAAAAAEAARQKKLTEERQRADAAAVAAATARAEQQHINRDKRSPIQPTGDELHRLVADIRGELNRVGCETAATTPGWHEADQKALESFVKHSGGEVSFHALDRNIVKVVGKFEHRVCPLHCKAGYSAVDSRCEPASALSGAHKTASCSQINERAQLGLLTEEDRDALRALKCR